MSHKPITGLSPRHIEALELCDTLECLGLTPTKSHVRGNHVITAADVKIEVVSAYSFVVKVDGHKPFKTRSSYEVKKFLMGIYL